MNKNLLFLAALALAACGGGGGGSNPIPVPVTHPPVSTPTPSPTPSTAPQDAVHYSWSGALAPGGSTQTFAVMTASTPIPVQASLCDPRVADCRADGSGGTDIDPTVVITDGASPAPTAAPTLSPPPGIAMALQHSASPTFTYKVQIPTQAGCGNVGVTFPNATGKIRTCAYSTMVIGCVSSLSNQPGGGYSTSVAAGYSFDTQSAVTDPSAADVYLTGPTCPGAFQAANAGPNDYEFYCPHGCAAFAEADYTLATLSPTQWSSQFTQIAFNQNVMLPQPCGSTLTCLVIARTASGNFAEFEETRYAAAGPSDAVYGGNWLAAAYAVASGGQFPQ